MKRWVYVICIIIIIIDSITTTNIDVGVYCPGLGATNAILG